MPNKKMIQRWVDALESGEYEQGTGALRSAGGYYCCLGVLCEIAVAEGIATSPRLNMYTTATDDYEADMELPHGLATMVDIDELPMSLVGRIGDDGGITLLSAVVADAVSYAELNDVYRFTFKDIATMLRYQFLDGDVSDAQAVIDRHNSE